MEGLDEGAAERLTAFASGAGEGRVRDELGTVTSLDRSGNLP